MRVLFLFSAVLCILIDFEISEISAQNFTTTPDNSTTTSTTPTSNICTVLDPPTNISILPYKTSAFLNLSTNQTDYNCFPDTIIVYCEALREENEEGWQWIIRNSTANSTVDNSNNTANVYVEDLSEFTNYTCNATLSDGRNVSEPQEIKFRTDQEVSDPPYNLTVTEKFNTSFTVQWEKPSKNPGMFVTYVVHVVSQGPGHFIPEYCELYEHDEWIETTNETYSFFEAYPDYTYEVTVFLQNSAGNGSETAINFTTDTSASGPPTEFNQTTLLVDIEGNFIMQNISWNMPCDTNGKIDYFKVEVEGNYILNYTFLHNHTLVINATESERYFTKVQLRPAFLYTIKIQANGINEGEFFEDSFITEDNVPGPPIIESITARGPTNFTISWTEPKKKAGTITNYTISIDSLGPLYDMDINRCPTQELNFTKSFSGNEFSYTFQEGRPYYSYRVSIAAATSKGYGNYSTITANTTSAEPEKPQQLELELLDDNTTATISWITPCDVNGPIREFYIEVEGNYTDDWSINTNNTSSLPYENGRYNYDYNISLYESYNYEVRVWITLKDGTNGSMDIKNLTTPDGYPGPPNIINVTDKSNDSFTVLWKRPSKQNGRIIAYQITVTPLQPLYETTCIMNSTSFLYNTSGNTTWFRFTEGQPFYNYSISVEAETARGWGEPSNLLTVATEPSAPENVQNIQVNTSPPTEEQYNAYANISFNPPCRTNGHLLTYKLSLYGRRQNYYDVVNETMTLGYTFVHIPLKPEYLYEFTIETKTKDYNNTTSPKTFIAPAGIPQFSNRTTTSSIEAGTTGATITLHKADFDVDNGNINYIALILSERNETGGNFSRWDYTYWPDTDRDGYRQLTEDWWYPFNGKDSVQFTIGNQTTSSDCVKNCNKLLESGKDYYLIIRLFTTHFYKNSNTIHFRTEDTSKLGAILGIIFSLLIVAVVGFGAFYVWRKKLIKLPPILFTKKSHIKKPSEDNMSIPIHKFLHYCKNLENNPEKFVEQYMLLTEKSKEIMSANTTTFAELTENRRKNRYTNILPYDATRVKLLIDEDDEIGSDYINASYIKGYSGNVEYIATQGPLPTTCRDFWKMVIQENVSIIVMVTQFVEDSKEKCYKYFPNNHETMTIGDDMEVRCTMELHFGTYCVRTIQVKRDSTQVTVTHMQYLDWPDFNVPNGTGTMLQFCHQLRERLKLEGGYVIVHCSAGVGRTGTLIATDILIQAINAGKNIDIFNTVLELRRQRMIMVQAQKQYVYIHNLIRDTLESQTSELNENLEPFYENQSPLQMKTDDDNLINKDKEKESQF